MAYSDVRGIQFKPGTLVAVAAIQAAIGYTLITGLATDVIQIIHTGPMPARNYIDDVPPPPPPPEQIEHRQPNTSSAPLPYTPPAPFEFPTVVEMETTDFLPKPIPEVVPQPGTGVGPAPYVAPEPTPRPGLDPVSARPRNDPGSWVTHDDYKSSWINQDMTGVTAFRVEVGTNGRVLNCTVTRSSGHRELDDATCRLVTQRARFNAAKDGYGEATSGTFASSVRWQVPD